MRRTSSAYFRTWLESGRPLVSSQVLKIIRDAQHFPRLKRIPYRALTIPKTGRRCRMDTVSAVERYGTMVYRLAYAQLRSRHDADDVFQEVFLRYHRASL